MTEKWKDEAWAQDFWFDGKVTRRRVRRLWGAPARSARACWCRRRGAPPSAPPSPTRSARSSRCPVAGAAGGKTALVGLQMAVDRINKNGGINGRPVELIVADDESSSPAVGAPQDAEDGVGGRDRRPCRRLPLQHLPRLHAGLGAGQDRQHDQRVPRHHADHARKCNRYSFRVHDYAPAQAVAFAPYRSTRWARSGTSPMPTIPGASRRATPMPTRSRRTAARSSAPPAFRSAPPT